MTENKRVQKKIILAIETSCDDTGVAALEFDGNQAKVLVNLVSSQTATHAPFGGVVPNLASREHQKNLPILIEQALQKIKRVPDFLAVTKGPGLIPSLLVGVSAAKALGFYFQKKIFQVNHLKGHLAANFITKDTLVLPELKKIFPALGLIVSGGHTEMVLAKHWNKIKILGETRDDAAGEAFDKAAKLLGLGYPGGPAVSQWARNGNASEFSLPRPMIHQKNLDFSFSGLKTSLLYLVKNQKKEGGLSETKIKNLCAAFEDSVVSTIATKTERAIKIHQPKTLFLTGGVAANQKLRASLKKLALKNNLKFFVPQKNLCTDNALMIGLAAIFDLKYKKRPKPFAVVKAEANLRI